MNITRVIGMIGTSMFQAQAIECGENFIAFGGNDAETESAILEIKSMMNQAIAPTDAQVFEAICECVLKIEEYEQHATQLGDYMKAIRTIANNALLVVVDSTVKFTNSAQADQVATVAISSMEAIPAALNEFIEEIQDVQGRALQSHAIQVTQIWETVMPGQGVQESNRTRRR